MRDKLEQRLAALDAEHQAGERLLADLDAKRRSLTETLLRIEGAMQVLREMINEEGVDPAEPRR